MAALANLVLTILLAFIIPLLQFATANVPSENPTVAAAAPTPAIKAIDATPPTPAISPTKPTHWCATTPEPSAPRFVKVIRDDESTNTDCRTIVITSSSL